MGIGGWVKKQAKKAKKKGEQAKRKAEEAAREAARKAREAREATERKAREARDAARRKAEEERRRAQERVDAALREAEKGVNAVIGNLDSKTREKVMGILDDVQALADQAKGRIDGFVEGAEDKIDSFVEDAKGAVDAAKDAAVQEVAEAGKTAIETLDSTFSQEVPELVTEQAPRIIAGLLEQGLDHLQVVAQEIQQAISGPGIEIAKKVVQATHDGLVAAREEVPELIEFIDAQGTGSKIGPMRVYWSGIYTRAETLIGVFDRYIESPPRFCRRDIRDYLTALGPDWVTFDVDIKANVVVLGSTIMEGGVDVPEVPFPLAVYLLDKILEAAGVPE